MLNKVVMTLSLMIMATASGAFASEGKTAQNPWKQGEMASMSEFGPGSTQCDNLSKGRLEQSTGTTGEIESDGLAGRAGS